MSAALVLRIRKGEQITESQSSQICMCCDQPQQPLDKRWLLQRVRLRCPWHTLQEHFFRVSATFWDLFLMDPDLLQPISVSHIGGCSSRAALARRDWCDVSFPHHDNLRYGVMRAACGGRPGHYLSGGTGDPAVTSWPQALGLPVPRYRLEISHSLTGGRGEG